MHGTRTTATDRIEIEAGFSLFVVLHQAGRFCIVLCSKLVDLLVCERCRTYIIYNFIMLKFMANKM